MSSTPANHGIQRGSQSSPPLSPTPPSNANYDPRPEAEPLLRPSTQVASYFNPQDQDLPSSSTNDKPMLFGAKSSQKSASDSGLGSILTAGQAAGRCRVCLELIGNDEMENGQAVHLGCSCLGDLAIMHYACAEKWFGHRGSRQCEVCGEEAKSLPSIPDLRPPVVNDVLSIVTVPGEAVLDLPWMSWRVVGMSYLLALPMVWMTLQMQELLQFGVGKGDHVFAFEVSLLIVLCGNLLSWIFCKLEAIARQRYSLPDYIFKLVLRFGLSNYLMGRCGQISSEDDHTTLPWYYFCLALLACEGLYALVMICSLGRYIRVALEMQRDQNGESDSGSESDSETESDSDSESDSESESGSEGESVGESEVELGEMVTTRRDANTDSMERGEATGRGERDREAAARGASDREDTPLLR